MSTCCENSTERAPDPRRTAQDLWKRYHQQADTHTENDLVQQYLPLVSSILGRLAMTLPDHVDQDDLKSAGLVGLLQALRNYDPGSGNSFETYARVRIRGAMLDELRRMDWVPRTVHEKARKIQQTMAELEQKLGESPTEAQVAKAMGLSVTENAPSCWMKCGPRRLFAWTRFPQAKTATPAAFTKWWPTRPRKARRSRPRSTS